MEPRTLESTLTRFKIRSRYCAADMADRNSHLADFMLTTIRGTCRKFLIHGPADSMQTKDFTGSRL
jgi:hypothetical protein